MSAAATTPPPHAKTKTSSPTALEWSNENEGPVGCYLVYESSSGGRLTLHYSQGKVPENAVGFWCPGKDQKIQGFKFKQNAGRSELIKGIAGGDANRRKYFSGSYQSPIVLPTVSYYLCTLYLVLTQPFSFLFSGWCQFLKQAVAKKGLVIQFTAQQGVAVDVYGYLTAQQRPMLLELESGLVDVSEYDAIAVMPKDHEFLRGVKSIVQSNFLELGNLAGASTTM